MVSAPFYRDEAKRCRALAAATHDPQATGRWLRIAKDYDELADAIVAEEMRFGAPSVMQAPAQHQQPMQQQQSKTKRPE